jgi:hypothetical protein
LHPSTQLVKAVNLSPKVQNFAEPIKKDLCKSERIQIPKPQWFTKREANGESGGYKWNTYQYETIILERAGSCTIGIQLTQSPTWFDFIFEI